jgi:hypothetical protein
MTTAPRNRLVIVVRADPLISGHSGEARNLQDPDAIAAALDRVCVMSSDEREGMERRARARARQFDRAVVFNRVLERVNAHLTGRMAVLVV